MKFLLSFFTLTLLSSGDEIKRPAPALLTITNGYLTIGIDKAMGASITHLSWKSLDQKNTVNSRDPGRLIQQSYYAGKSIDRKKDSQHKAWSPWPWNPIQGGGVRSWSKVTRFEKSPDQKSLTSATIPNLWDMPAEPADAVMKQWTTFEPGLQNTLVIKNQIICSRQTGDLWGPALPKHQEVPACYFTSNFSAFKSYLGNGKWRIEKQAPGPPWGQAKSPRQAMACFEKSGQGIAIFSPSSFKWNFGPCGKEYSTDPSATSCSHLAPVALASLGPQSTLTYRYWLIVGTEKEISSTLDRLWKKYANGRLGLTNPKK